MAFAKHPSSAKAVKKFLAEKTPLELSIDMFENPQPQHVAVVTRTLKGGHTAVRAGMLVDAYMGSLAPVSARGWGRVMLLNPDGDSTSDPLFFNTEFVDDKLTQLDVAAQGLYHLLSGPDWVASREIQAQVAALGQA
jgi:hypothetical protein